MIFTDTGGTERFRTMTTSEYQGASAVIHVFDLHDPKSHKEVMISVTESLRFTTDDIPLFLFGNKLGTSGLRIQGSNNLW